VSTTQKGMACIIAGQGRVSSDRERAANIRSCFIARGDLAVICPRRRCRHWTGGTDCRSRSGPATSSRQWRGHKWPAHQHEHESCCQGRAGRHLWPRELWVLNTLSSPFVFMTCCPIR
jgi:hypothetical protein